MAADGDGVVAGGGGAATSEADTLPPNLVVAGDKQQPQVWELGPYLALASSFRIYGLDGGSHGDSCCDFSTSAPQVERTDPEGLELVSGEGRHEGGEPFLPVSFPPRPSPSLISRMPGAAGKHCPPIPAKPPHNPRPQPQTTALSVT